MTRTRLDEMADLLDADIDLAEESDNHRSAPQPDPKCLYGLVGDVARAGSDTTEANPFAIAANFLAYMSCAVGRAPFMLVGNTCHHARLFTLHVGRSGRGRKGDAVSLIRRLHRAVQTISESDAPQVHSGGLSSREGLVFLIHDGYTEGKREIPPIDDKRVWVIESEFANVLHQGKRDGNTLSAALRDCWDGIDLKPATKSNRLYASDPHVGLSGAVTPTELRDLIAARELSNGFANRFLVFWSERTRLLPFPKATPQSDVDKLAQRIVEVLRFCKAGELGSNDSLRVSLNPEAQQRYAALYLGELNDNSHGERINALIERRAPMVLRIAVLLALCDRTTDVTPDHIEAALAWVRLGVQSVKFVFASAEDEVEVTRINALAEMIVSHLKDKREATRADLSRQCFRGHVSRGRLDAAIDVLLTATPPRIELDVRPRPKGNPGSPTKVYRLPGAKSAK